MTRCLATSRPGTTDHLIYLVSGAIRTASPAFLARFGDRVTYEDITWSASSAQDNGLQVEEEEEGLSRLEHELTDFAAG